jgi:tetraacyldisaccharide 4'-kinase
VTLERHWQRITALSVMLCPVSLVFRAAAAVRRFAYCAGFIRRERLPVPVVIVGNISVGGTGKTPLVLWVAQFLESQGIRAGIVSRGYGGDAPHARAVAPDADPTRYGDEPVLLAQRSHCPVWVGEDRAAAARALLAAHPECTAIVSDDGLQHYRLHRDVELAVIDGERGLGNGLMLPAGPLREPPSRLKTVDAAVVNGPLREIYAAPNIFGMRLEGREFVNVLNTEHIVGPEHFHRRRVLAVAGIGNPARFFAHLRALGITFDARAFADHHRFTASDLAHAEFDAIVMTEKDAVKCAAFASENLWALRVEAVTDPALGELILDKLKHASAAT